MNTKNPYPLDLQHKLLYGAAYVIWFIIIAVFLSYVA